MTAALSSSCNNTSSCQQSTSGDAGTITSATCVVAQSPGVGLSSHLEQAELASDLPLDQRAGSVPGPSSPPGDGEQHSNIAAAVGGYCGTSRARRKAADHVNVGYLADCSTPAPPPELSIACPLCEERFARRPRYLRHLRVVHRNMPDKSHVRKSVQCPECDKTLTSGSLKSHQVRAHGAPGRYLCCFCGEQYYLESGLKEHEKSHYREKLILCDKCPARFGTVKSYRSHLELVHHKHEIPRPFVCSECGKGFRYARQLEVHSVIHTDERPFTCSSCASAFKTQSYLNAHVRIVHAVDRDKLRKYQCNECGRRFKDRVKLNNHQMIHLNIKPKKCPHCDYACIETTNMRLHISRRHRDEANK